MCVAGELQSSNMEHCTATLSLAGTYDYIRRVGTVSEAPPYIFQCQQLAHIEDSTELAKRLVDY